MNSQQLETLLRKFEKLQEEQLEVDPDEKVYLSLHVGSNTFGIYFYNMGAIYLHQYLSLKFSDYTTQLNKPNEVAIETFQDILDAFENSEYVEDIDD